MLDHRLRRWASIEKALVQCLVLSLGGIWSSEISDQSVINSLTLEAMNFYINHENQRFFFKFDININVLVTFIWFIWIPMLWVYGHYKSFTLETSDSDV